MINVDAERDTVESPAPRYQMLNGGVGGRTILPDDPAPVRRVRGQKDSVEFSGVLFTEVDWVLLLAASILAEFRWRGWPGRSREGARHALCCGYDRAGEPLGSGQASNTTLSTLHVRTIG